MTTMNLTSDFRKSYGINDECASILDASTKYVILARYSDSNDRFVLGAVSSRGALGLFLDALRYYSTRKDNVYVSDDTLNHRYTIQSILSERHISVTTLLLHNDDYVLENCHAASFPVDKLGCGTAEIDKFDYYEGQK